MLLDIGSELLQKYVLIFSSKTSGVLVLIKLVIGFGSSLPSFLMATFFLYENKLP